MTPEQIEQIINMLTEKLGPMAQVVWDAYLRQTMLMGAMQTCVLVLAILSLPICLVVGLRAAQSYLRKAEANKYKYENTYTGREERSMTVACIIGMIGVATFLFTIEGPMRLLNPAYYAIQELLGR